MHTLGELLSQVRSLDDATPIADGESVLRPATKILIPGAPAWKLPADPDDAAPLVAGAASPAGLQGNHASTARSLLCNEPSFVAELAALSEDARTPLTRDITPRRHHKYRQFVFAVAVRDTTNVVYGRARLAVLEGEPRPGRSTILAYDEVWFDDLHEAAVDLGRQLLDLPHNATLRNEPGGTPWLDAVALLGGGADEQRAIPPDWKRTLEITAALYAVRLDVRPNPDSARTRTVGDLRSKPPKALLVWQGWVKAPDVYLDPFRSARPDGYAQCLGAAYPPSTFGDDSEELHMHLAIVSPVLAPPAASRVDDWDTAAQKIKALQGPHFKLSERVRTGLHECPYPNPQRMLDHVTSLEQLARAYARSRGALGGDICKIAIAEYRIEIALFDSKLAGKRKVDGVEMDTTPHVKVDDYKTSDACGRIYFAIIRGEGFVVDHIGLHDYT